MASSSGTKPSPPVRKMSKTQAMMFDLPPNIGNSQLDSDMVPSSLPNIALILRVANEIENDNPRVAHLCRLHALEEVKKIDPTRRGIRQLKTYLSNKIEEDTFMASFHMFKTRIIVVSVTKKDEIKPQLARTDAREIQLYYQIFYEKYIAEGQDTKQPEEMAKFYRIAMVLYDVLKKTVVPSSEVDYKTNKYAKELESKKEQYDHYNILPLYAAGKKPSIMKLREINAAFQAIRNVENLPMPIAHSTEDIKLSVNDIFDWLLSLYGFQKGNIANQREHLILLLANLDVRKKNLETYFQIDGITIQRLSDDIFLNYELWCGYMHCDSHNRRYPRGYAEQQLQLIYIALYLLIWGEASNIRFMPECICYIFHNMASDVFEILSSKVHPVSDTNQTAAPDQEYYFLETVIKPIYDVLHKAMVIIAWTHFGSVYAVFDEDFLTRLLSIFITSAILNLLEAILDIALTFNAWKSFEFTQILRYLMKLLTGAIWVVILPISYSISMRNPTGVIKYTMFWIMLLVVKLTFSYFVEVDLSFTAGPPIPKKFATIMNRATANKEILNKISE
ncbi:hypothetical protein CCACVL1_30881 [Corchorus capsularis]|uniref:1,3-beta-glucan synthase component FKS1-like domain-containing protein n=1 Tax=Corchorus capsularis TaxID=210143 RepID=A0A1R3FUZ3_COCAP|nr:hypothetical protein CCACVL1_30881 [Corchorus capsularis]